MLVSLVPQALFLFLYSESLNYLCLLHQELKRNPTALFFPPKISTSVLSPFQFTMLSKNLRITAVCTFFSTQMLSFKTCKGHDQFLHLLSAIFQGRTLSQRKITFPNTMIFYQHRDVSHNTMCHDLFVLFHYLVRISPF